MILNYEAPIHSTYTMAYGEGNVVPYVSSILQSKSYNTFSFSLIVFTDS